MQSIFSALVVGFDVKMSTIARFMVVIMRCSRYSSILTLFIASIVQQYQVHTMHATHIWTAYVPLRTRARALWDRTIE